MLRGYLDFYTNKILNDRIWYWKHGIFSVGLKMSIHPSADKFNCLILD